MVTIQEHQESKDNSAAHEHLDAIYKLIKGKKEDDVHLDYKIHRQHIHMVSEMGERKEKGKKVVLSDGNVELLSTLHGKLKKLGRI